MANPFGGFVHTSPLSSLDHDPVVSLASNCIRDYFGPTVQTAADCLESRGGASTLSQLVSAVRGQCRRPWNEERERLVSRVAGGKYKLDRARGPATAGYVVEVEPIREALLILIQHSLLHVDSQQQRPTYRFLANRAMLVPRYPRFVEYAKKALDETAAALVEELLVGGRMMTVDAVVATVNRLQELGTDAAVKTDRYTLRQAVVESFRRLVEGGFIEKVSQLKRDDEKEYEFEGDDENKAVKVEHDEFVSESTDGDDPAVVELIGQGAYRNVLPRNTVWRVNVDMFHESLRAFCMGRLVAERFGHKVQSAGSIITAALKLAAHKRHALKLHSYEEQTEFTPDEIVNYLPKPVQQALEKKPGGTISSLSRALVEISQLTYPTVLFEMEEVMGHPNGGKFQVAIRQLVDHMRDRVHHQVSLQRTHARCVATALSHFLCAEYFICRLCSIVMEKLLLESVPFWLRKVI